MQHLLAQWQVTCTHTAGNLSNHAERQRLVEGDRVTKWANDLACTKGYHQHPLHATISLPPGRVHQMLRYCFYSMLGLQCPISVMQC